MTLDKESTQLEFTVLILKFDVERLDFDLALIVFNTLLRLMTNS